MVNLTSTETFEFPVDRQDLYNLWANAALGTFPKGELDPTVFTMDVGTELSDATSSPQPGHVFWSRRDGLMFVFHDEVDNTGVSLWLACGPDRYDVACLAAGPLPAAAVVRPLWDRWVGVATGASARIWGQEAIGSVASGIENGLGIVSGGFSFGGTLPSGTWQPVSIDGIVWGYTTGNIDDDRWIRVTDGSSGAVEQNTSGGVQPQHDDVIGMGIFARSASTTTPQRFQYIWTGPRVINLL